MAECQYMARPTLIKGCKVILYEIKLNNLYKSLKVVIYFTHTIHKMYKLLRTHNITCQRHSRS